MIRIGFECALVFLLPALVYFGYRFVMAETAGRAAPNTKLVVDILQDAPLALLFGLGCLLLVGTLLAFATLQDQNIDKPYQPAIYKNGRIQ